MDIIIFFIFLYFAPAIINIVIILAMIAYGFILHLWHSFLSLLPSSVSKFLTIFIKKLATFFETVFSYIKAWLIAIFNLNYNALEFWIGTAVLISVFSLYVKYQSEKERQKKEWFRRMTTQNSSSYVDFSSQSCPKGHTHTMEYYCSFGAQKRRCSKCYKVDPNYYIPNDRSCN